MRRIYFLVGFINSSITAILDVILFLKKLPSKVEKPTKTLIAVNSNRTIHEYTYLELVTSGYLYHG